jgi:hypothetical protein
MNQSTIDIMEANRKFYITVKDGYVRGLNEHERNALMKVMHEEFNPNYVMDWWCGACVMDFIKLIYRLYDERRAAEAAAIPPVENVKANFPRNNKPKKYHYPTL